MGEQQRPGSSAAARQERDAPPSDVELADVRLLDDDGAREAGGNEHSWYSASGRGYSVDGRQVEAPGGVSHVATVLGEALYSRERRNQQVWDCITGFPHRAFNVPSLVLSLLVLILLGVLALQSRHPPLPGGPAEALASPQADHALRYDWRGRPRQLQAGSYAVAADHGRCSDIGKEALQRGGNAVDAAVAAALCQGLMNPMASGIGGGTIMLVRLPNGTAAVIDARETAPAAANETMFTGNSRAALRGGLAVAVPLELKGLWKAHKLYGSAPWASLVRPAADIARAGFPAHPYLISSLRALADELQQDGALRSIFLKPAGAGWRVPDVNESCCVRPQLAAVLDAVAREGPAALYEGSRGQGLAADVQAAGGILTGADLVAAEPEVKAAIQSQVFGLDVFAPPPPSSAAALIAALHMLEGYSLPLSFQGGLGSHRLVEAMKNAFALRTHLGDPGNCSSANSSACFLDVSGPLNASLSRAFADSLRDTMLDNATQSTAVYGGVWHANSTVRDDHGTSHLSVVDASRMAVALTTTVNTAFGAMLHSNSTGLILNNEMDDFSTPGFSNIYGLAPSRANFIRPGKKPLSSMSPLVLAEPGGGRLRAVVGASGGPRIMSGVLTTLVRLVAEGQAPFEAVAAPRLHHQLLPDVVFAERQPREPAFVTPHSVLQALRARGHAVQASEDHAVTQLITVDPDSGRLTAVSDPRKDGAPAGL